ncbi:hypothetical protein PAEPH01_0160 [Pancytospora epiphaga]|nr:hypothetical protein PAEPH01_0160 [Pancytospora epiphaga]
MLKFSKIQTEIALTIAPKFIREPFPCIFGCVSKMLLQYSSSLHGIPLAFTIDGVTPQGEIQDDGSVELGVLISYCVVLMAPGDVIRAEGGLFISAFSCQVNEDNNYNGDLRILKIESPAKIVGESFQLDE